MGTGAEGHGITGVVLEHQLPKGKAFVPLLDAQRAIRTVRSRAAGTHFGAGDPKATDAVKQVSCHPDFMVLVYPVIGMGEKGHAGSRSNLLGKDATPELIELFSNEQQTTRETPPAFFAHALDAGGAGG